MSCTSKCCGDSSEEQAKLLKNTTVKSCCSVQDEDAVNLEGGGESAPLLSIATTRIRVESLCCELEVGLVKELLEPLKGVREVRVSSHTHHQGYDEAHSFLPSSIHR